MRRFIVLSFWLSTLLLTACEQNPLSTGCCASVGIGSSSARSTHWNTYQDGRLGIRVDYPSDEYSAEPDNNEITASGYTIRVEGVRIGDMIPEGNGVHIYVTDDKRILNYLQEDKPFTRTVSVNGMTYQQFEFIGLGDVYGYVSKKDGRYYVFESMWGPDNPVSEKMLQSLVVER